jgi:hypothetical protein
MSGGVEGSRGEIPESPSDLEQNGAALKKREGRGDGEGSDVVAFEDGFYFESRVRVGVFHDGFDDLGGGVYMGLDSPGQPD